MNNQYSVIGIFWLQILLLAGCVGNSAYEQTIGGTNTNGFDEMCKIFTEAMNSGDENSGQVSAYIEENIKSRLSAGEARDAYEIMFHLEPEKRYALFKRVAESDLKREWQCEPMRQLLSSS